MKALTPILLVIVAIAGLFLYVKPQYAEVKDLRVQADQAQETLDKVQHAQQRNNELVTTLNSFKQDDLNNLQKVLPDNVDVLRLMVDLNRLADSYKTTLRNVSLPQTGAAAGTAAPTDKDYSSTALRFTVTLSYRDFISFMQALEGSLRLTDITAVSFKPTPSASTYDYQVSIKVYWLN